MADKKNTKTTTATEVKTVDQLREDLSKLQLEHLESRRSHKQGELVNPHVLTAQRKNIARTHGAITVAYKAVASSTNLSTKVEEK